jgi:hypothetical protein
MKTPRQWRAEKVRLIERNDTYIRFTPNFGFSFPWFRNGQFRRRVRFALHHGLQIVEWRHSRWFVSKQVLGKSKVKYELFL